MNKKIFKILPILMLIFCLFANVEAAKYCNDPGVGYDEPCIPSVGNNQVNTVITTVDKVWASVILIVQIVSVGCMAFAGVRYMFASADQKADIKKGLIYLVIGATLVFATSTVIKFVFNIGNEIITST